MACLCFEVLLRPWHSPRNEVGIDTRNFSCENGRHDKIGTYFVLIFVICNCFYVHVVCTKCIVSKEVSAIHYETNAKMARRLYSAAREEILANEEAILCYVVARAHCGRLYRRFKLI